MAKLATNIDRLLEWLVERTRWGPLKKLFQKLRDHWRRFIKFGSIGLSVFLAGAGLLYLLVSVAHLNALVAYAIQAVFSVELSFILNYHWSWKERKPEDPKERRLYIWSSLRRWNLKATAGALINQAIYTGLIVLHVQYMLANVITTAIFLVVNYYYNDKWTFVAPRVGRHRKSGKSHRKPRGKE